MKFIAGLIGLFSLVMVGAAAAAASRKREIVPIDDEDADEVRLAAIFAPLAFHSTSGAFRGGSLDCWYGGGIVDLRDATLDRAGAHIDVKAIFGGSQILVPDDWRVETTIGGIGGARDVRPARDRAADAPLLTLSGTVLFGGVGVASTIPKEAFDQVAEAIEKRGLKKNVTPAASPNGTEPEPEPVAAG